MPRSKRRGPSSTNHNHTPIDMSVSGAHEESLPRHPSKRLRHTSRFEIIFYHNSYININIY